MTFAQPLTPPQELNRFKLVNALIDGATGLSLLVALLSSLAARQTPPLLRTLSYSSFLGLCLVQAVRASSNGVTRRHIVSDAVDQAQLIASNRQVMHQQRVSGLQLNLQDRAELLRQIDAIPDQRDQVVALKQLGLATGELGAIVAAYEARYGAVHLVSGVAGTAPQTVTVRPTEKAIAPKEFMPDAPVQNALEKLSVRDLATDYLKLYQNLLVAGESGTGKSCTMLGFIENALKQGQQVFILDAKNSSIYDYIQRTYSEQMDYLAVGSDEGVTDALNKIDFLIEQMMSRDDSHQNHRPIVVVIDEYNILLDAAVELKMSDIGIEGGNRSASAGLKSRIRKLMNQGRTRQHRVILSAHTADAQYLGLKGGSYMVAALARNGDFSSIDSFLGNYSAKDKSAIETTVNQLRDLVQEIPVVATSIPKPGVYKLPYQPRDGRGNPVTEDTGDFGDAIATNIDPDQGLDIAGALTLLRQKYRDIALPSAMAFFQELDSLTPDYDLSPYFEWAPHLVELVGLAETEFTQALNELLE